MPKFCTSPRQFILFIALPPTLFSLGLWLNINTGWWHITSPQGMIGWMNAFRATLPYIILPLSLFIVISKYACYPIPVWAPSHMLTIYGIIAIISSLFSPIPIAAVYFGIAYLSVVFSAKAMARQLDLILTYRYWMHMTWIVNTIMACILIYIGRKYLAVSSETAYGIIGATKDLAGTAMSRSSGIARFAAVPGVIALSRLVNAQRWKKVIWVLPVVFFFYIVYKCQSRGAIFASLVSIPMVFFSGLGRFKTVVLGCCMVIALMLFDPELIIIQKFEKHIQRGQKEEEFKSMTGRTRPWKNAMIAFADSPILLGRGNWADRAILGEHAHNAFVQALMIGGLLGFFFYVVSWISGWHLFYKIIKHVDALPPPDRSLFLEASAVMTFFFIRSIPETTTASYAVDLVIMIPVFCYLEFLDARLTGKYQDSTSGNVCRLILKPVNQ